MPFEFSFSRTVIVTLAISMLAAFDLVQRMRRRNLHLLFAVLFGSLFSIAMLKISETFFSSEATVNSYISALALLLIVLAWKSLFGPWEAETKAAVLGTFLFWVGLVMLGDQSTEDRRVHVVAGAVALVPAVIWCSLFLKYHQERRAAVILMFLSGMLSTVPILFYDALVRHGVELQFFVMRIVPESFHRTADAFVSDTLGLETQPGALGTLSMGLLLSHAIAFLIVGTIEEISKYWVMRRSGRNIFTSIDDVMQLSIIVAVGFSFAENVVNPVYFKGFVKEYLLDGQADFLGFFSSILGRSVLTSMVHIVSTGVLGYFVGVAFFASPYLMEQRSRGRSFFLSHTLGKLLRMHDVRIFRTEMITLGIAIAIVLHGCFNLLVTLPDLLPGNPRSFGDLLHAGPGSFWNNIPLLMVPAMLYVVGGFWLLTWLFLVKQNMQERGHLVQKEEFIP